MKIAVLSGKGGAGKTFVSVNLAAAAQNSTYIDCDAEEPDGKLFFKPTNITCKEVYKLLPSFDSYKCSGCRKCVNFCEFNALAFIKNKPLVFPEICHSCGGCSVVCKENAITEVKHVVGIVETGKYKLINVVTGTLNIGEASPVPVIKEALKYSNESKNTVIIDCPPGSGCSVMESISEADCCILVAEPTSFGFYNFKMVFNLCKILKKPTFVVINKEINSYKPLEAYCIKEKMPILLHIAQNNTISRINASGTLAYETNEQCKDIFDRLLKNIRQVMVT